MSKSQQYINKLTTAGIIIIAVLATLGLINAYYYSKEYSNRQVLKAVFAMRAAGIAETMTINGTTDFEIAERIADDIKTHMSYDYTVKVPWYHNLTVAYTNDISNSYANAELKGICTDFAQIYNTMLQGAGLESEYISQVKVTTIDKKFEHAYVDVKLDEHLYRIDITSYCTAEHNNAQTDFCNYLTILD